MRTLALDIGDVRIGLALSDATGTLASPLKVISARPLLDAKHQIKGIIDSYEVEQILIGLPLTLAGEEGSQARHVKALAEKLFSGSNLPRQYHDERLSSISAKDVLFQQGLSEKEARGKIDMIAASIFLQAWLDTCHSEERDG